MAMSPNPNELVRGVEELTCEVEALRANVASLESLRFELLKEAQLRQTDTDAALLTQVRNLVKVWRIWNWKSPTAEVLNLDTGECEEALTGEERALARIRELETKLASRHRAAVEYSDIIERYVRAMRAAVVDAELRGPEAGMVWIWNTLLGPGMLPDVEEAKAEGGAQAMFDREQAKHEAFRAAHPVPEVKA